jgi:chromate reductase, NAD(P)H dehydrogenase (quinone)
MARNVALIVGSLRKQSITRKVAHALVELAPPSLQIEDVPIASLALYNADLEDSPPRAWVEFRDRMRAMEAVLLATPEYNRSVPAPLKNAIDVGSRPYGKSIYSGKPCGIISVSPGTYGGFGANHHLRQSCVFLDMPVMQQPETYVARADKMFDEADKINDDRSRDMLRGFIEAFARWVDRFAQPGEKRSAA